MRQGRLKEASRSTNINARARRKRNEADDIFYTWENYYEDELLDIYLNFFIKNSSGSYDRMKEHHIQRYYSLERLKEMAEKSKLSVEAVYGDLSFEKPNEDEERIFLVLKKCEF